MCVEILYMTVSWRAQLREMFTIFEMYVLELAKFNHDFLTAIMMRKI